MRRNDATALQWIIISFGSWGSRSGNRRLEAQPRWRLGGQLLYMLTSLTTEEFVREKPLPSGALRSSVFEQFCLVALATQILLYES